MEGTSAICVNVLAHNLALQKGVRTSATSHAFAKVPALSRAVMIGYRRVSFQRFGSTSQNPQRTSIASDIAASAPAFSFVSAGDGGLSIAQCSRTSCGQCAFKL